MTRERISSWVKQITSMLETINTVNSNLDQLAGNLHIASAVENDKHQAAIQTEIARFSRDRDKMLAELCQRTNRNDLDGVNTLLLDINIRLEMADNLFREWRGRLAQLELLISTGELKTNEEEGPTAKQMNEIIDTARTHYEAALKNADQLIPNKAVLIHA